ncbi:cytochrome c oxidase subunit II [Gloeocapsa sp. PCC 73106]|uniref:cytochrome c oxidase subunit II n=1 Tax=Gloeocapsa sp. PCC 73106 TaxID=102232 RepID=UPI0002AC8ED4|nr:cytochrome c oxidase subunit II [Gloeocapsa sp. PCC 73106]ELR98457.1 heme/copper-type cytochrome/quinol oxidase, subunit 2 [Gloeocapsa sp. PCC 73106]
MNIPSNILTLIAGIVLTAVSLWYGQNHGLMPVAASAEAAQVDGIFNFMMTIACGLFLIVQGVLIFVVIKFRRREGDTTDGPPLEGNIPLEIVWTAIPTIIVFILAIYSFEVYNTMGGLDPMASMASHQHKEPQHNLVAFDTNQSQLSLGIGTPPEGNHETPIYVEVNGIQYAWIFTYTDSGIVGGDLHVPVGHPIHLNIKAGDVIHAFWLPEFRIKQDAIPGRDATLTFTPTRIGEYPVICAELCGAYHGGMKTVLHVLSDEDYQQWVQDNTIAQGELEPKTMAIHTSEMSDGEYLAPYAQEMGVNPEIIAQLKAIQP